jgi:hypothetical protein
MQGEIMNRIMNKTTISLPLRPVAARQLAADRCHCQRCNEARQREQLDAVKRAVAPFLRPGATHAD